jgi:hypothetical protein
MVKPTQKKHSDHTESVVLRINARKIATGLGVFALVLALVSLTAQFIKYVGGVEKAYGLIPRMDVDREMSVPSLFSVELLFSLVLILAVIAIYKCKSHDKYRFQWVILALGFLFMTFDEGASIHELIVTPLRGLLGSDLPDFLTFVWILPGMAIVLLLAIYYLKFFLSLSKRMKKGIVISGGVYLCGLLGMELVGGVIVGIFGIRSLIYNIVVTIEESLEMIGLVLAIYTFLDYFRMEMNGNDLDFK